MSVFALLILTLVGQGVGVFGKSTQPTPRPRTTTTPQDIGPQDGAAERSARPVLLANRGDLEAGNAVVSQHELSEMQEKPAEGSINMAAMDGAG